MKKQEKMDRALPQRYWACEKVPPKMHAVDLVYPRGDYVNQTYWNLVNWNEELQVMRRWYREEHLA